MGIAFFNGLHGVKSEKAEIFKSSNPATPVILCIWEKIHFCRTVQNTLQIPDALGPQFENHSDITRPDTMSMNRTWKERCKYSYAYAEPLQLAVLK
jgi:hypothetical protein